MNEASSPEIKNEASPLELRDRMYVYDTLEKMNKVCSWDQKQELLVELVKKIKEPQ